MPTSIRGAHDFRNIADEEEEVGSRGIAPVYYNMAFAEVGLAWRDTEAAFNRRQSIFDRLADQIEASILRYQAAYNNGDDERRDDDDGDVDEQQQRQPPPSIGNPRGRKRTCVKRTPHVCLSAHKLTHAK